MTILSKSKLIAYRQCPKRLWLEVHRPESREDSAQARASFAAGHRVGSIARQLYDPEGRGSVLDIGELGVGGLVDATRSLLQERRPIFEAGFSTGNAARGALALADVLQPHSDGRSWELTEVKSSTSVKAHHEEDVAIQHHIAAEAGITLKRLKVAYIDSGWTYRGDGDYRGLLAEQDLTVTAASRSGEVTQWLDDAHRIVANAQPPSQAMGRHCKEPFGCGFDAVCRGEDEALRGKAEHPVRWLPMTGTRKELRQLLETAAPRGMEEIPDDVLNARQLRVKQAHLAAQTFFDAPAAEALIAAHALPALFLDFETISDPVPAWAGTRPYQQIPFQFSLHRLSSSGELTHCGFLQLNGEDPRLAIAQALVACCGSTEPVYAYSMGFEGARLGELAECFPQLAAGLLAIRDRLVDLRPIAENCYYHPRQQGSWSIKSVLPTIAPELAYDQLGDVQDGGGAVEAYREAVAQGTSPERREQLREQLWTYCRLDTFAMVRLWSFFSGRAAFAPDVDDGPSHEVSAGEARSPWAPQ